MFFFVAGLYDLQGENVERQLKNSFPELAQRGGSGRGGPSLNGFRQLLVLKIVKH